MFIFGAFLTALMVGFRFEVGADWAAYKYMLRHAGMQDLDRVLTAGDPAYQLLNWIVGEMGADLWAVNLVCSLIFSWGLVKFAIAQRQPWLTVLVAVPYLVIVVAMGYTRQAVAIGILMAGLSSRLQGASLLRFAAYVAAAGLFHKTAVVAFPLVALASERSKLINILSSLAIGVVLYDVFLSGSVDRLVHDYIVVQYGSEGAAIRVAMNIIPAALFLMNQERFGFREGERLIWRNFSLAALALAVALYFSPSSTAVDRVALYIIPLQLAVLAKIPGLFTSSRFGTVIIVVYSFAVQFTWLEFARHAQYWVPYQFYPF